MRTTIASFHWHVFQCEVPLHPRFVLWFLLLQLCAASPVLPTAPASWSCDGVSRERSCRFDARRSCKPLQAFGDLAGQIQWAAATSR